jgi:hypothetical protein
LETKSLAAGILLAFGISNLLEIFGIGFAAPRNLVIVANVPIGTIVVAIVALALTYYLAKGK